MSHKRIATLLKKLIDVDSNRILIPASCGASGYWFGGGNMVLHEGAIYLCGRYRDQGDSRTGTKAGVRGRECAVFKSEDGGVTFHKTLSLTKQDLSTLLSFPGLTAGNLFSFLRTPPVVAGISMSWSYRMVFWRHGNRLSRMDPSLWWGIN